MSIDVHPPSVHTEQTDEPQTPPWSEAQLLVLQHPELARVRFSCACSPCHHQILTRRFCADLADAWMAVRGGLVHPADVPAV